METFMFASDLHGDRREKPVVQAFLRAVDEFKPKLRGFGGDIWDFRAIREGAAKDEKIHSLRKDFYAGMAFVEEYRPHFITLGNHDQRLWDLVHKNGLPKTGPMADLGEELIEKFDKLAARLKITVLPYDKRKGVYRYGGLKFLHGYSSGKDAATETARVYGNALFGHGHAIDEATEADIDGPKTARMIGCLCELDMTYNRAQTQTLRQEHGWAYGAFLGRGKTQVFQARVQGQQVIQATTLRTISL